MRRVALLAITIGLTLTGIAGSAAAWPAGAASSGTRLAGAGTARWLGSIPGWGRCRRGVLSFLNGWTRELHAGGHRSGVCSGAAAAVASPAPSTG